MLFKNIDKSKFKVQMFISKSELDSQLSSFESDPRFSDLDKKQFRKCCFMVI